MGWLDTKIRTICRQMSRTRGVSVGFGKVDVPHGQVTVLTLDNVYGNDNDTFVSNDVPKVLAVPSGLGGRYLVHAKLIWEKSVFPHIEGDFPWTPVNFAAGYFRAFLMKNDDQNQRLSGSTVTASAVAHARKNTQQIVWEGDLQGNDSIQVCVWQSVVKDETYTDPGDTAPRQVRAGVRAILTIRRLGVLT